LRRQLSPNVTPPRNRGARKRPLREREATSLSSPSLKRERRIATAVEREGDKGKDEGKTQGKAQEWDHPVGLRASDLHDGLRVDDRRTPTGAADQGCWQVAA
jgi:hypothetical protein